MAEQVYHIPVMPAEVLEDLAVKPDGIYLDGTAGGGNHSRLIAERLTAGGKLYALDQDPDAIAEAGRRLAGLPAELIRTNFTELGNVLAERGTKADGILLDLGVSSWTRVPEGFPIIRMRRLICGCRRPAERLPISSIRFLRRN